MSVPPNDNKHGTKLVEDIIKILDEYLNSPKVLATPDSPLLVRMFSGTALGAKQSNIAVAKQLKENLSTLQEIEDQDAIFETALNHLNGAIQSLQQAESKTLLNQLYVLQENTVKEQKAHLNRIKENVVLLKMRDFDEAFKGVNIFEKVDTIKVDINEAIKDLPRSQEKISIDGVKLSEMVEGGLPEPAAKKDMDALAAAWKEGKTPEQQALIEKAMPYLSQKGVLFQTGTSVVEELIKIGMMGSPRRQNEITIDDNSIHVREHYIFESVMDISNPQHTENIELSKPLVFTHEFTMTVDPENTNRLIAKTDSLVYDAQYKLDVSPIEPGNQSPGSSPKG